METGSDLPVCVTVMFVLLPLALLTEQKMKMGNRYCNRYKTSAAGRQAKPNNSHGCRAASD